MRADRQTDIHTNTMIAILHIPYKGGWSNKASPQGCWTLTHSQVVVKVGGIFYYRFTTNLLLSQPVKELTIGQYLAKLGTEYIGYFFRTRCRFLYGVVCVVLRLVFWCSAGLRRTDRQTDRHMTTAPTAH